MKGTLLFALALGTLVLAPSMALAAEPTPEEVERARTFFNAGAQAYGAANYADAVRSFEQAYAVAPRPQVLFSLAQAERKLFLDRGEPSVIRHAIAHYKEYLEKVPTGGRRSEAIEAKAELEARLARLDPREAGRDTTQEKRKPRVTVFSPTAGARASLDGGPPQELPYFADLEPGKHRVRVFGDGYFDAEQDISGDKGIDVPVNLALREKPALVTIALDSSAEIFVDGRHVADAPLDRPIEVSSGPHVIAIAKNGKKPWSQDVVLERGKPIKLDPKLATSGQRVIACSMLATGGAALLVGGLFALGAVNSEERAQDVEARRMKQNLTPHELADHNRSIDERDDARTAAIVLASVGAAATVSGALFYFFDKPPVALLPPRSVELGPKHETPLDVTATLRPFPVIGPSMYGAGLTARF
jgi:hypothetical protein